MQWTVGVYLASALLKLSMHGFHIVHDDSDHRLFTDSAGQLSVAHPGNVQMNSLSLHSGISRWGPVAESLGETACLSSPFQ